MRCGAIALFLCALPPLCGQGASFSAPAQISIPGGTVIGSISFAGAGAQVSGVQFDLHSDAPLSVRALPGSAAGNAGKVLYSSRLADGGLRVVVVGLNSDTLADGELLRPIISVDAGAAPGPAQVRIDNVTATSPDGARIDVPATPLSIEVGDGAAAQPFDAGGIVNSASYLPSPVSPGDMVTIFGGPALAQAASVQFNGMPGTILYAGPGQVNALVPFELAPGGEAAMEIRTPDGPLGAASLATAAATPALFTESAAGTGPGVILNGDGTVNSFSNPAGPASTILVFGTGFGEYGSPAAGGVEMPPLSATIGGVAAEVTYAGPAPNVAAGVAQINVRIPEGIGAGPAVPIAIIYGSAATQRGVTVFVH